MEENFITIIEEDGTERLHEIILTFPLDEYGKEYVVFTPVGNQDDENQDDENQDDENQDDENQDDENQDDEDEIVYHVASFIPDESGEVGQLFDIEDEEEWAKVQEVISAFEEDEEE